MASAILYLPWPCSLMVFITAAAAIARVQYSMVKGKGRNARGLPLCAWEASQNQTGLPIPAFKVGQTEYLMWNQSGAEP